MAHATSLVPSRRHLIPIPSSMLRALSSVISLPPSSRPTPHPLSTVGGGGVPVMSPMIVHVHPCRPFLFVSHPTNLPNRLVSRPSSKVSCHAILPLSISIHTHPSFIHSHYLPYTYSYLHFILYIISNQSINQSISQSINPLSSPFPHIPYILSVPGALDRIIRSTHIQTN